MSEGYPLRPLGDVMHLEIERISMVPEISYRLAGVLNAGKGLVAKGDFDGADTEYKAMNVLRVDQVVMRKLTAWEGPITVVPAEFDGFVVSSEFPTFVLGPDLLPDWMRHVCRSPRLWAEMKNRVKGTVQRRKRLNPEQLLQIKLPIPPLDIQARIVEMLDAIDDQISSLGRKAVIVDALWWSISTMMIKDVAGRESVNLGSIADISGGLTKNKKDMTAADLVEVPYLRVANVQRRRLVLDDIATIMTTREKLESLRLLPGDVLMNEGGDRDKLGRGDVWRGQIDNCIHQNHVFRARVTSPDFVPEFVSTWGNTFGRSWFQTFGTQTTGIASINKATLSRFPVPVLDGHEQLGWVERLQSVADVEDSTAREAERLRAVRTSLLSALLNQEIEIDSAEGDAA